MALYNNVTAADVKGQAANIGNEVERYMARWKYFADTLSGIPEAEMTALGISSDFYANVMSMRSDLLALEAWYRANCAFVKRFSQLVVF